MPVSGKLAVRRNAWYLWHWTHTGHVVRLYTAPKPPGPWTEHPTTLPPTPDGFNLQLSSGDIVWDKQSAKFWAAPNIDKPPDHYTILLHSTNGENWDYATPERAPILGPSHVRGSWDENGASYTRFLRDYLGNLIRVKGKAYMFYRGRELVDVIEEDFGDNAHELHRNSIGVATSTDMITWTPVTTDKPLFELLGRSYHSIGSALQKDDKGYYYLTITAASGDDRSPGKTMYIKKATRANDPLAWDNLPGTPISPPPVKSPRDGGSYAISSTGHWMTYSAMEYDDNTDQIQSVRLLKGI